MSVAGTGAGLVAFGVLLLVATRRRRPTAGEAAQD
jgi:MYXO-CTERM domain-containing protein